MNDPVQHRRKQQLKRLQLVEPPEPVGRVSKKAAVETQDWDLFDASPNEFSSHLQKDIEDTSIQDIRNQGKPLNASLGSEKKTSLPITLASSLIDPNVVDSYLKNKPILLFSQLGNYLENVKNDIDTMDDEFVVIGCIWDRIVVKEGKNGNKFAVCKLCDLHGVNANILILILTKKACDKFWKENEGTVFMIISPRILQPRSHGEGCAIHVEKEHQIWILGKAKYFGRCAATRKDGQMCPSCIDTRLGSRCVFHERTLIKKKTFTKRPELNSVPLASVLHPKQSHFNQQKNISKGVFDMSFGRKGKDTVHNSFDETLKDEAANTKKTEKKQPAMPISSGHAHGMRYLKSLEEKRNRGKKQKEELQNNNLSTCNRQYAQFDANVDDTIELTDSSED